jgi:CRISPR-associated protein Cmr1
MNQIKLTLETVTPLFLGGAKGKDGPPELRPPAFRGAMRYWFRAAAGGVIGDKNLEGLHKLESAVFGDTDSGSPITVRVVQKELESAKTKILPHKSPPESGVREAFRPEQQFDLILQTHAWIDPVVFINAAMSLNLALLFGGIGLRSRRGAGSLMVTKSSMPDWIPPFPTKLSDWKGFIQRIGRQSIKMARKLAEMQKIDQPPEFSSTYPHAGRNSIVRISNSPFESPTLAMQTLMNKMPKDRYLGYIGHNERQASPLWVRVIKADGQYRLLFCVLPSNFRGADYAKLAKKVDEFATENIEIEGWNK